MGIRTYALESQSHYSLMSHSENSQQYPTVEMAATWKGSLAEISGLMPLEETAYSIFVHSLEMRAQMGDKFMYLV